ncbi:cytochrome c oxidase assembly factor CtaG [Chungangia koreensis]|uniref:Cytochrome c oxidase assembly factor CtaG n=1 Tax=Chungangia koreensis TaxID=752657 RepID=A0ABV8X080_9LACT
MSISIFGFQALWSPWYFVTMVLIVLLYFLITVKWQHKFEGSQPLQRREAISFVSGIIVLYIVKGSPVDLMGHIMFTFHMVQMAFLLLLVPPLLLGGVPGWLWNAVVKKPFIDKFLRIFTNPILSLIIFTALFSFYHIPLVHDTIKYSVLLHAVYTFILFTSAVLMWMPVLSKDPNHQLDGLRKMLFIIASAVLITPACALIIFADAPMYETYTSGEAWLKAMALCVPASTLANIPPIPPEVFTNVPALYDQQMGGVIMKVLQEIIYGVFLFNFFIAWYRSEKMNADEITQKTIVERQRLAANSRHI